MSIAKKNLLVSLLVAATVALTYEARVVARDRVQLAARQKTVARLAAEVQQAHALRTLDNAAEEPAALAPTASPETTAESSPAKNWIAQTKRLRQLLAACPDQVIPELKLLEDRDWLFIAQSASLVDEAGVTKAFGALRSKAKELFAVRFMTAFRAFLAANGDELPANTAALLPYFNPPIDRAILDRYEMIRTGKFTATDKPVISEKSPVDFGPDGQIEIGLDTYMISETEALPSDAQSTLQKAANEAFKEADEAFKLAHGGRSPATITDALPYIRDPSIREKAQDVTQAGAAYEQANGSPPLSPEQVRPYLRNPRSLDELFSPPAAANEPALPPVDRQAKPKP